MYAPPVDLGTFYDEETLNYLSGIMAGREWAIHLVGPDEIHYNVDFEKDPDADDNPELTQRTALKISSELNAFVDTHMRADGENPPLMYHCVVFRNGEPWTPDKHDGPADVYAEWFDHAECDWFCNQCFNRLPGKQGCPEHAPLEVPGFQLADCGNPEHPRTFVYADNGGYGAPCGWCAHDAMSKAHEDCEHRRHRAWRRWRATDRAVVALSRLRLVKGSRWSSCNGRGFCVSGVAWRWAR